MTSICIEPGGRLVGRTPGSPLEARLRDPAASVPLTHVPERWFHQRIELLVAGHAEAAADPVLTGRLRGAWGRALMRGASADALAGRPCPWDPPCALDPLFREQGAITGRLTIPHPYVLSTRDAGGDLLVLLTLFGFACDWLDAAAEALVAALRCGDPPPLGRPAEPLGRRVVTTESVAVPRSGPAARLTFHTPVAFRREGRLAPLTARTLISGLGNRISGLARWQDAAVAADWANLAAHAENMPFRADDVRLHASQRRSGRQDGRTMPMEGWLGSVLLEGDVEPVLPLLALGATCHVGSHAALGLGAYSLETGEGILASKATP